MCRGGGGWNRKVMSHLGKIMKQNILRHMLILKLSPDARTGGGGGKTFI